MTVNKKKLYERAIANWPQDDRPREKLLKHGADTLSNAEMLAIPIRTGVKGSSAVDLGRELLRKFKTLRQMSASEVVEFREIKGLRTAKIAQKPPIRRPNAQRTGQASDLRLGDCRASEGDSCF